MNRTYPDIAALVLRLTLGLVMLPHGLQKTLGWFGGMGWSGTYEAMTGNGLPAIVVVLVILIESVAALTLILGLFTRFSAFSLGVVMTGAAMMHVENGFFMNWFGTQLGEGYEYHLLMIGLAIAIILSGPGRYALDTRMRKKV